MPKEDFLSAVAKRRRLNGNISSATSTPSTTSRSQSPLKVLEEKAAQNSRAQSSTNVGKVQADDNSFAALVNKDIVQFSSSREVKRLDDLTLKIRLSRGQTCNISGRYNLWVKDGIIELLGARLEACTKVYNVFATATNEVPALVALSKFAEIEVSSYNDETPWWTGSKSFEHMSKDAHVASFLVHGYSVLENSAETGMVKAFDSSIFSNIARRVNQLELGEAAIRGPTILLCGKSLAGGSVPFTCMLNSVITSKVRGGRHPANHGMLVLDLDITAPAFSPAGTATLAHISSPLLGSPWHFPVKITSTSDTEFVQILKMLYIGRREDIQGENNQFDVLFKQLHNVRREMYQGCPVIIKACGLLNSMDLDRALRFTKQIAPNLVVCYGSEAGPIGAQLGYLIATEYEIPPPVIIPIRPVKEHPLPVQHELVLQSYFHSRGHCFGQPVWSHLPLELDESCRVWLSVYGESTSGLEIRIPETSVNAGITLDALVGCMVAVTCAKGSEDLTLQGNAVFVERPRPDTDERPLECLGFAVMAGFSPDRKSMCLLTPISHLVFDTYRKDGECVVLVVQDVDLDGHYDTAWVQSELDTLVDEKRARKTVFRRKLHVL